MVYKRFMINIANDILERTAEIYAKMLRPHIAA
jgi:hypothetical protein